MVGVFVGIQAANWNDARGERDLEVRNLQRLEIAPAQDIVEHDDAVANYYGAIEAGAQWNYIREHTRLTYMDRRSGVLTPRESRRAWRGDGSAEFTPDQARALIERVGAQPRLVE